MLLSINDIVGIIKNEQYAGVTRTNLNNSSISFKDHNGQNYSFTYEIRLSTNEVVINGIIYKDSYQGMINVN